MLGYTKKTKENDQSKTNQERTSPARMRVMLDLQNLPPKFADNIAFKDTNEVNHMHLTITPDTGVWRDIPHVFEIVVPDEYPFKPPRNRCLTPVYSPNFDEAGNHCHFIDRENWKPNLTLNDLFQALESLFYVMDKVNALNLEAAKLHESNRDEFERRARSYAEK
jgi:ubiquitin-conjugating enzyme E2 M